jgi:hypothetical protein
MRTDIHFIGGGVLTVKDEPELVFKAMNEPDVAVATFTDSGDKEVMVNMAAVTYARPPVRAGRD